MKRVVLVLVIILMVCGCTENRRAKSWGGTATENLEPGKKLVMVTWKDSNIWMLTRPMKPGEIPETYEFIEKSSLGVLSGKIIIKESAQ